MGIKLSGIKLSEAILRQCPQLKNSYAIKVGVADGSTYPNGQSVAQVAEWNEYGNSRIPARPFMAPTLFKHAEHWPAQFAWILKQSNFKVDEAVEALANMIVGQVKMEINEVWEPPLAASTLAARVRKSPSGEATDKPLIDTGLMFNSITYQVEKK